MDEVQGQMSSNINQFSAPIFQLNALIVIAVNCILFWVFFNELKINSIYIYPLSLIVVSLVLMLVYIYFCISSRGRIENNYIEKLKVDSFKTGLGFTILGLIFMLVILIAAYH